MGELKYNNNSKFNKKDITGYCLRCLEKAIFRATLDKFTVSEYRGATVSHERGVIFTSFTCTRCLYTRRYKKKGFKESSLVGQILIKKLTFENKFNRFFIRLKFFFTGKHLRKRFDFRILRGR